MLHTDDRGFQVKNNRMNGVFSDSLRTRILVNFRQDMESLVNIWGEPFYRQSTRSSHVFSITIAGDGTIVSNECTASQGSITDEAWIRQMVSGAAALSSSPV